MAELTTDAELSGGPPAGEILAGGRAAVRGPLSMLVNAVSVMGGKLATMALGFVFWLIAARLFEPTQVGLAAAVVSGMMLCTQLALLGVGSAIIHDFPHHLKRPGELLNPAISLVSLSALATGAGFVLVTALSGGELAILGASPAYSALFLATSILGTLGILLDQTSIAIGRGDQVLTRGLLFGAASLAALALAAQSADRSIAIFFPWLVAGVAASVLAWFQLRRWLPGYRLQPGLPRPVVRRLVGVGLPNWALTLTERAPGLVLPLVVTELLSPETNATWYAVWMMAWVIYVVPISIGLTLFAEARHRPHALKRATDQGMRAALAIGCASAAVLALVAPLALSLLGSGYADAGTTPLRILVWAVVPMVFVQAYFASCRAVGRLGEATLTGAISGVVSVVVAGMAGVRFGLDGMALAWLVCQSATGIWALLRVRVIPAPPAEHSADEAPGTGTALAVTTPLQDAPPAILDPPVSAVGADDAPGEGLGGRLVSLVLLLAALAAWFVSLRSVDTGDFTDLGVISALPPLSFIALGAISIGFAICLRSANRDWRLPAAYVAGVVTMLSAMRPMIEDESAFRVTWRHLGVTEYILRTGGIDASIDAYFNWPGFFVLAALVVRLAGLDGALALTEWFPLAFNLAIIGPLYLIFRTATRDMRVVWLGIWIFTVTNWVGQDYFSPQALALVLHLVVVAILLRWFCLRSEAWPRTRMLAGRRLQAPVARFTGRFAPDRARPDLDQPDPGPATTPIQRAALMAIAIAIFATTVPTHQLTPFASILGVGALVLAGICTARRLPALMVIILAGWLSFLAVSYLTGHIDKITGQVGNVQGTVGSSVGGRIVGSDDHLFVIYLRLAFTAAIWAIAGLGALRAWRLGRRLMPYLLLAASPFPLLAAQSYGGEILLRVYLFGLPFMALLAAFAVFPRGDKGRSWATTAVVALASSALIVGFMVTRYGNERMDYFSSAEVTGVERAYDAAPQGSLLIAGSGNLPWKFRQYDAYDYRLAVEYPTWALARAGRGNGPVLQEIVDEMRARGEQGAFFIITRSQKAEADLIGLGPPGSLDRLEADAVASPSLKVLFRNEDSTVLVLPGYRAGVG